MEKLKAFVKSHPMETALLAGVSLVALYYLFSSGSGGEQSQQGALQSAYFAAETTQAQTGAAIQVANINAGASVAEAQLAAGTQQNSDNVWSSTALAETQSNNQAATSALPYAAEDNIVNALSNVASQTQTSQTKSSGFFGLGAGAKSVTTSTPAAMQASTYLDEIAAGNGSFAING